MAIYTVQDTTMTALGDAVRSKVLGTTELPISTFSEQYILYNKTYSFEFPTYVKKIKIVGTGRYTGVWEGNANGYQGVGIAPRVYTSEYDTRRAEGYTVVYEFDKNTLYNEKYFDFEAMVEGNSFTLVASIASSSSTSYYLTYTAIGLDENGNEFKYTPAEIVNEINSFNIFPEDKFLLTGSLNQRFSENNGWDWALSHYIDKWHTENIASLYGTFAYNSIEKIPFKINGGTNTINCQEAFYRCLKLKEFSVLNLPIVSSLSNMFHNCQNLREITDEQWNIQNYIRNSYDNWSSIFAYCYSLRRIPTKLLNNLWNTYNAYYGSAYYRPFLWCCAMDEINGLGVSTATFTSNVFQETVEYCQRLKNFTFAVNEDGTPKTANWKSQVLDLSVQVGYDKNIGYITKYNSGITADKEVKDDATYQVLKDDPDWFTKNIDYSRYNHDSAVNTINSLPDCSGSGGTNTIKFKGQSGALTDGGAINTLTEEEIAVATSRGWTVSLV